MKKKKLTPRQAVARWEMSIVPNPCKVIARICRRSPHLRNKDLVARCIKAGVSPNTAKVRVSRFKSTLKTK